MLVVGLGGVLWFEPLNESHRENGIVERPYGRLREIVVRQPCFADSGN